MSSEDKIEAKVWCLAHKDVEVGTLDVHQTKKLLTALYAAGAENVYVVGPSSTHEDYSFTDTLHIKTNLLNGAPVMTRLANFHPDETQLLQGETGYHVIRAWWD